MRLRFPLAPLRVIATTVAAGATSVALDVDLGFELSLAATVGTVRLGPAAGPLATVVPQQTSATAWRVPHAPFAANTTHVLEVTDVTTASETLVPAVFQLMFTTGP